MRTSAIASTTALCACIAVASPQLHAQQYSIEWDGQLAGIRAADAPVHQVVADLASVADVTVLGLINPDVKVSIELEGVALVDGFRRLLEKFNYVIVNAPRADGAATPALRIWVSSRAAGNDRASGTSDALESASTPSSEPSSFEDRSTDSELARLEESGFFDEADPAALLDTTKSPHAAVRARALDALAMRDRALAEIVLIEAVSDPDALVSGRATALLDQQAGAATTTEIGKLFDSPDVLVRFTAIELLRRREDQGAIAQLRRALHDEDEDVRAIAADVIAELERGGR